MAQCGVAAIKLTKRDNNGAGDTVGHNNSEDTHHPGVSCPKLELIGLVLQKHNDVIIKETTSPKIFVSSHDAYMGGKCRT